MSTVAAILLFFAGLARVGPSVAAILSVLEPVVTIGLAAAVFSESLSTGQLLGGALVLAAVLVVQWPVRRVVDDAQVSSAGIAAASSPPARLTAQCGAGSPP